MSEKMSEKDIYEEAKKRIEEKKGFFIHFSVYILVNILLAVIWFVTGAGFPWFLFPLGGWGIGVLFHFLGVFVFSGRSGWEKRELDKEVERMKKSGE